MFDVTALFNNLTLSAEDKAIIADLLGRNPDAVTSLQTQASTYIDSQIGSARTDLDTKRAELEAEWTALRSYRGGDEDVIRELEARVEKSQGQLAIATARLETVGKRAGIDVEPLLKDIREAAPVTTPKTTTIDTPIFNEADVLAKAGRLSWNAVEMNAALFDIDREHQRLFGKPIDSASVFLKDMAEEARRTNNRNLTPQEFAEKKYGFAPKRAEIQEAAIVQRETAAAAKALETYKSEQALRVTQTGNPNPEHVSSPIFSSLKPDQQSPVHVNGVSETVSAAILDFRKRTAAA